MRNNNQHGQEPEPEGICTFQKQLFSAQFLAMAASFPVPKSPKPNCSYHCMIGMALIASPSGKLPVNEIYKYILNNFPYFKTAADNWKNSVRHCLSLGQCFHKVTHPGSFHFKKGFHWQLVPDKQGMVYQEIFKYLASKGEKAEIYGISSYMLGVGLSMSCQPPRSVTNSLTTPVHTPSQSTAMLQLNQSDLETLRILGDTDSNLSLSPVDYNLLMNPNMQQELLKIAALLGFPSVSQPKQPSISSSVVNTFSYVTPQKQIVSTVHRTPPATLCSAVNTCQPPVQQNYQYVSTVNNLYVNSPPAVVPSTPCPTLARGVTITPLASHKVDDFNTGIEYCSKSPPVFVTRYPSAIELELSNVVTDEDDETYPFIIDDLGEDGDISLSQLNCENYEDLEDPLILSGSKTSSHHSFSIDPVEGDWNCWGEPSYLDRINTLINPKPTQTEVVLKDSQQNSSEKCVKCTSTQKRKPHNQPKKKTKTTCKNISRKVKKEPLKVSIPFLKLLTSRQAKKYCRT